MSYGREEDRNPAFPYVQGEASDHGRVYQASGDQLITEHHHHYPAPLSADPPDRTIVRAGVAAMPPGPQGLAPDSVRMPLADRPPRRLRDRHDLMQELNSAAESGGGIHVLYGMGGNGKTAVAYTVFKEAVRRGCVGLWINASDRMTLRAGMLAVAADRGAQPGELVAAHSGQRAPADLVWHYLAHSAQPWLLVIDNADDPLILEEGGWLRESPIGTVLVTTRNANSPLWYQAVRHRLDVLPLEDAAQVLCDLAPNAGSRSEAESVARTLGCLPLALTLAGSYLAHQLLESWTMSEYNERLRIESTGLVDQGATPDAGGRDSRHLVSRTWQIALDALSERGLPEATALLRLLSCWGADPLPLTVLARSAFDTAETGALDPALRSNRLEAALRGLLDHSLVALLELPGSAGGKPIRCIQAHGVLLDSVSAGIPAGQRLTLMRAAVHLLDAALPEEDAPGAAKELLRLLAPHISALLQRGGQNTESPATRLAVRVAKQIHETGDYEAALALMNLAGEVSLRTQGADHADTLATRHQAGDSLRRLGRLPEAVRVLQDVLADRERVLGPDHPDTLLTNAVVAIPLYLLNREDASLACLYRAIEGQRRVLGEGDPETLRSRAYILEVLAFFGRTDEFLRLGPSTVADCERFLGPDHPVTGIAYSNYAFGLIHAGTPQDAETAARQAVEARIRILGPEHPLVYSAKLVHSWALMLLGSHDDAVRMMREAVDGRERLLGANHPLAVKARVFLAERLAAAGQHEEAQQLLDENLANAERIYGPDDPDLKRARTLRPE